MSISFDATGKIVVGTDLSGRATIAVEWAADRAVERGKDLVILTALPEVPIPHRNSLYGAMAAGDWPSRLHDEARHNLKKLRDTIVAKHPGLNIEARIEEAMGSYALAQASKTAELVVIGARGQTAPLRARALGGTALAVIAHAHGPVAVIHDQALGIPGGPVIVGMDDSPESEGAFRYAATEALARGVRLHAVHAVDLTTWTLGLAEAGIDIAAVVAGIKGHMSDLIDNYASEYPGLEYHLEVKPDRPASALITASGEASLVVVGARGLGGFAGLLLGSTSRAVVRETLCPVIVVRAPKKKR
ncbi:MAG: universal stress protein [Propioniciclava sp.]|uniref:universal stress protein n=1 Tax=Propioniciclava sp. TaxID=2038686 RepID=UPI0039E3A412